MTAPDGDDAVDLPTLSPYPVGRLDSVHLLDFVVRGLATEGEVWMATLCLDGDDVVVASTDPSFGIPGSILDPEVIGEVGDDVVVALSDEIVRIIVPIPGSAGIVGHLVGRVHLDGEPVGADDVVAGRVRDLTVLGAVVSASIERDADRDRLQRRIEDEKEAALLDVLTGLGNRRGWRRARLREEARARRSEGDAVVVVCDLDGLKEINDTQGHKAGDALIARTADALRSTLRTADEAFRVGGDEFVVLLTDIDTSDLASIVGRFRVALDEAGIAASLGASTRSAQGSLARAFEEADERMYADKAKRTGRPGR